MAESTLSIGYVEFATAVARQLGLPPGASDRSALQITRIDELIQAGVRQAYYPPPLPGEASGHEWTFLKPVTSLTTVADDWDYDLPDDYGGIEGYFSWNTTTAGKAVIRVVSEQQIRKLRQFNTSSGYPRYAAVRPKAGAGSTGQRFEVIFFPTPNGAFSLQYRYNALQSLLSTSSPYPLGGMIHGEMFKRACMAVAELEEHDEKGVHWDRFMMQLTTSVSIDRKQHDPEFLGYNSDPSILETDDEDERGYRQGGYVTYNGTLYGDV